MLGLPLCLLAQENEQAVQIESLVQSPMSLSFYKTQSTLWQKETVTHPEDANAWFNYYKATRYVWLTSGGLDQEGATTSLTSIVDEMEVRIPNTFEYHYTAFINSSKKPNDFHHLEKAYRIDTGRYETYEDFVSYHEVHGNPYDKKIFCKKLYDSGYYHNDIYIWNYNVLIALDEEAVLITMADIDTYPAWVLQSIKGIRPDVEIVNLYTLQNEEYRQKKFFQLDLPSLDLDPDISQYEKALVLAKHISQNIDRDRKSVV